MDENLGADLELSHSVLNYLNANLQGLFACQNVLSQLGYHEFQPDSISICQNNIEYIDKLLKNLSQGIPVLSRTWKSAHTQDAKELMVLLTNSKNELHSFASKVEKTLIEPNLIEDSEQTKLLIGAYSRFAYTNEHYIKGYIDYGNTFTLVDLASAYQNLLPQAEKNVEAAHLFFDIYTSDTPVPPVFYRSLFEEGLFLPGVFRTTIHDFNRHLSTYNATFDFSMTDIPSNLAEEWKVINIDAVSAGYWNAFNLTAKDFVEWMQVGINTPRASWFWKCLMFEADVAGPWIRLGFEPPTAREWANSNFTADEALDHIQRGLTNPLTARDEGRKIIE